MGKLLAFPGVRVKSSPEQEWQGFYSFKALARLTRIPIRTLQRWRQLGVITPSAVIEADDGTIVTEGYTYVDLTIARLIRGLTEDRYDFKRAADALRHLFSRLGERDSGWANARVYFVDRFIFAEQPDEWPVTEATQAGQTVMVDVFGSLFPELREIDEGRDIIIPREFREFVEINPKVMEGVPVLRGTGIPTAVLASIKNRGHSIATIARAYSMLSLKAIKAAISYEELLDAESRAGTGADYPSWSGCCSIAISILSKANLTYLQWGFALSRSRVS